MWMGLWHSFLSLHRGYNEVHNSLEAFYDIMRNFDIFAFKCCKIIFILVLRVENSSFKIKFELNFYAEPLLQKIIEEIKKIRITKESDLKNKSPLWNLLASFSHCCSDESHLKNLSPPHALAYMTTTTTTTTMILNQQTITTFWHFWQCFFY